MQWISVKDGLPKIGIKVICFKPGYCSQFGVNEFVIDELIMEKIFSDSKKRLVWKEDNEAANLINEKELQENKDWGFLSYYTHWTFLESPPFEEQQLVYRELFGKELGPIKSLK